MYSKSLKRSSIKTNYETNETNLAIYYNKRLVNIINRTFSLKKTFIYYIKSSKIVFKGLFTLNFCQRLAQALTTRPSEIKLRGKKMNITVKKMVNKFKVSYLFSDFYKEIENNFFQSTQYDTTHFPNENITEQYWFEPLNCDSVCHYDEEAVIDFLKKIYNAFQDNDIRQLKKYKKQIKRAQIALAEFGFGSIDFFSFLKLFF